MFSLIYYFLKFLDNYIYLDWWNTTLPSLVKKKMVDMHPNAGLLMEAEIRKLKMALIKEELNDKMKSFRAYMERMRNTTTPAPAPVEVVRPFDSILFMNVTGDFEVWHFVMLLFFAWFFLSKLNFNPNTPLYQKAIIKI